MKKPPKRLFIYQYEDGSIGKQWQPVRGWIAHEYQLVAAPTKRRRKGRK